MGLRRALAWLAGKDLADPHPPAGTTSVTDLLDGRLPMASPAAPDFPPVPSGVARPSASAITADLADDFGDGQAGDGPRGVVLGPAAIRPTPVQLPGLYGVAPVDDQDWQLLQRAANMVSADMDRFVRLFYGYVFSMAPDTITMFESSMEQQRDRFARVLLQWVTAEDPEELRDHLEKLGNDHRKYDVVPAHYEVTGHALIETFRTMLGPAFDVPTESAVRHSYDRLATIMIGGALANRGTRARWGGTITGHQRVPGAEFAIITIRPDQPYPFLAGQYASIELERRPRAWRSMSIASAPRPDNTFDIHVRALPGGYVSRALVMHSHVGDRVNIGPPQGGDLVIEEGTVSGLVCIGAGSGAAPLTAVLESVLAWPHPPTPIRAFVGARTADDLYPMNAIAELARNATPYYDVQVHGVVASDHRRDRAFLHGRVEEVAPIAGPWAELGVDVLVSGPNRMMANAVINLMRAGVPEQRIHFDQYEAST